MVELSCYGIFEEIAVPRLQRGVFRRDPVFAHFRESRIDEASVETGDERTRDDSDKDQRQQTMNTHCPATRHPLRWIDIRFGKIPIDQRDTVQTSFSTPFKLTWKSSTADQSRERKPFRDVQLIGMVRHWLVHRSMPPCEDLIWPCTIRGRLVLQAMHQRRGHGFSWLSRRGHVARRDKLEQRRLILSLVPTFDGRIPCSKFVWIHRESFRGSSARIPGSFYNAGTPLARFRRFEEDSCRSTNANWSWINHFGSAEWYRREPQHQRSCRHCKLTICQCVVGHQHWVELQRKREMIIFLSRRAMKRQYLVPVRSQLWRAQPWLTIVWPRVEHSSKVRTIDSCYVSDGIVI